MNCLLLVILAICHPVASVRVGVAKVNATMPVGVPLGGYNHGDRAPHGLAPKFDEPYTTFMAPSVGHLDTTWAKALFIDNGESRLCFVTIDAIGADSTMAQMALDIANAQGANLTADHLTIHGSHTHSGPAGITPDFLWQVAPAMDLLVPEIQMMMAQRVGAAIAEAAHNLQDAVMGVDIGQLHNVTVNRRAKISPYVQPDSIDPNLGVFRIDTPDGKPIATVWNFAIHGTCWGPDQMLSNSDIMGGVCRHIESLVGGVALFINSDAGDIDPSPESCAGKPDYHGAPIIAAKVKEVRDSIKTSDTVSIRSVSNVVDFGNTDLNLTLARFENCTQGGPLDICGICKLLDCNVNLHLNSAWIDHSPRFTAYNIEIDNVETLFVTIPGEALSQLGTEIRTAMLGLGFHKVMLSGYSNNHMGYFATPNEYDVGGYEGQLTFWGRNTADLIKAGTVDAAKAVVK